jgi:hypothetical protein
MEKIRSKKDIRGVVAPTAVTLALAVAAFGGFEIGSNRKPVSHSAYPDCPPGYVGGDTTPATSSAMRGIAEHAGFEGVPVPTANQMICIEGQESYLSPTAEEIRGESDAAQSIRIHNHQQEIPSVPSANG